MKVISTIFFLSISLNILFAQQSINFNEFFINATMRIDYYHIGDAKEEFITIDKIYKEGVWAGSTNQLLDTYKLGRYYIKVYDLETNLLIFSKGFDSYFSEYKNTTLAIEGIKRTYHESALIPFPKRKIQFTIEKRNLNNSLIQIFSSIIEPNDIYIYEKSISPSIKIRQIYKNGKPHEKVDIVYIAEGYTEKEENKFFADAEKFSKVFFAQEPYKSYQNRFNIYAVFKPSAQNGCDEPSYGIFKNTVINASFDSLGSARYLLTEDNKKLRDIAAAVPYDAIVILVSQKRYGGGGIYNLYAITVTDNQWSDYIFLHEFGHSFTGLADEYYTSSVTYNEFYPKNIEPLEPNITALLEPTQLKWKDLCSKNIDIPTPWEKEEFDKMDTEYQKIREELNKKITKLKKEKANSKEVYALENESEKLSKEHAIKIDNFLNNRKYKNLVGAFEGAGYSSTGLYRSMLDCIMFTKGVKPFCKACQQAIIKKINQYTK
mgnify:CR=1 FL=1